MMKKLVLDTSAILAFLEDKPGAEEVQDLLEKAIANGLILFVPVTSWAAVCEQVWRRSGRGTGEHVLQQLRQLPLAFVQIDQTIAKSAAEVTLETGLSLLTSIGAVIARDRKATFVTAEQIPLDLKDVKCHCVPDLLKRKSA
jgi:PIN domain nuclease of toxin-antitoxin system